MQIEYNTGNVTVLFVKLADGAKDFKVFNDERPYLSFFDGYITTREYLPKGNWRLIGNPFNLTEEQCKELVDDPMVKGKDGQLGYMISPIDTEIYSTAKQSFASLIAHHNIHQTNPLQSEWDEACTWGHGGCTIDEYKKAGKRAGNWIMLIKQEESC